MPRRMINSAKTNEFFVWGADNTPFGPLSLPDLIGWVKEGHVTAGTWIFAARDRLWQRALDVPELLLFFQVHRLALIANPDAIPTPVRVEPKTLRRIKLLAGLTDDQIERFCEFVELERIPQWAVIVKQGDMGRAMYVIIEGELYVRMAVDGRETILATLEAGDFFGDISLFDRGPRSADVVAAVSSYLLKISAVKFEALSAQAPDLATPFLRAIAKTLTARIRTGNKHRGEIARLGEAME